MRGGTAPIDRVLIELSGKANPNVLFIPTASDDNEGYVEAVESGYGALGCHVTALRLVTANPDPGEAARAIDAADLIYVGGGNTKAMIARWKELGVDDMLRRFVASGRPVGGVSAGAICWFRLGNSDWPQYEGIPGVTTAPLECLGIVDLVLCPHTRYEPFRMGDFTEMMKSVPGAGVGVDDACAIQVRGDTYRILGAEPGSVAHLLYSEDGRVAVTEMVPHEDFRPMSDLRSGIA